MKTQIKYFLITIPIAAVLLFIFRLIFPTPVFTVGNWLIPIGIALVLLILFIVADRFVLSLITRRKQKHERELIAFWSELARVTGMTFNREGASAPWEGASPQPGLSGLFHGHNVFMDLLATTGDRDSDIPARLFSRIIFHLNNPEGCSLTIRGKLTNDRTSSDLAEATVGLNNIYHIAGSPKAFLMEAIRLTVKQKSFLTGKPPGRVLFMSHSMLWSPGWHLPSIELNGPELTFSQQGVPTDVSYQVALLEMLSRLADLAEATEKGQLTEATPDQV